MKKALKAIYLALIVIFLYLPIGTLMVLSFQQRKINECLGRFFPGLV